jgi:hypothetical protein
MFGAFRLNSLSMPAAAGSSNIRVTNSTYTNSSGYPGTGKFNDGLSVNTGDTSTTIGYVQFGTNSGGNVYWNAGTPLTIEFFMYVSSMNANTNLWSFNGTVDNNVAPYLTFNVSQDVFKLHDGAETINTSAVTRNAWNHFVLQSSGSNVVTIWINGTQVRTSTNMTSNNLRTFYFMRKSNGSSITVTFDEFRVTRAALYTVGSSITVPTVEYTNGANTLGLFHCESTTQTDDTTS